MPASTLTLRLSEFDAKTIEELKRLTLEVSATKALMKAARAYRGLAETERRYHELVKERSELGYRLRKLIDEPAR